MTDVSSSDLEHQAERIRADIADTAERLREKLSPSQLVGEVTRYFRESDSHLGLDSVAHKVRQNPIAVALIGGGLAWLLLGGRSASQRDADDDWEDYDSELGSAGAGYGSAWGGQDRTAGYGVYATDRSSLSRSSYMSRGDEDDDEAGLGATPGGYAELGPTRTAVHGQGGPEAGGGQPEGSGAGLGQSAADMADKAKRELKRRKRDAMGKAGDLKGRAADTTRRLADRGRSMAERGRDNLFDVFENEPFLAAAVGVGVGVALGAALPVSRFEEEHLAEVRSRVGEGARGVVRAAGDVAGDVYAAAREAADEEGLLPGDRPIAERVAHVAEAAAKAAEERVDREFQQRKPGEASSI